MWKCRRTWSSGPASRKTRRLGSTSFAAGAAGARRSARAIPGSGGSTGNGTTISASSAVARCATRRGAARSARARRTAAPSRRTTVARTVTGEPRATALPSGSTARPIRRRHVHPDRAEQDQVERQVRPAGEVRGRQRVCQPPDGRLRMAFPGDRAHAGRGLDGDHVVAARREPRGGASATRADVERGGRCRRQRIRHPAVHSLRRDALVPGRRDLGVGVVPRDRISPLGTRFVMARV